MDSITIFYPSKVIGGAEVLFYRITQRLIIENKYYLNVIDYKEGYLQTLLKASKLRYSFYDYEKPEKICLENTIFFTSANLLLRLDIFKNIKHSSLLLYFIQPTNLISIYRPWKRVFRGRNIDKPSFLLSLLKSSSYNLIRNFLKDADVKYGLLFMDEMNLKFNSSFYNLLFRKQFLPIPIEIIKENTVYSGNRNKVIRLVTVSRLDNEKLHYLINLIDYVDKYRSIFTLKIVGTGAHGFLLKKLVENRNINNVSFEGRIANGIELDSFLKYNSDIGIAMGTSVLEFAKLGIPVIMTGPYFKNSNSVKYIWFHDTTNFDLAFWGKYTEKSLDLNSLEGMSKNELEDIGKKCFNKVVQEFKWDIIYSLLKIRLEETTLSFENGKNLAGSFSKKSLLKINFN